MSTSSCWGSPTCWRVVLRQPRSLSCLGWGNVSPSSPPASNITVSFLGQGLVPVAAFRDLGVTLDRNMTFNGHIASLTSPLFVNISSNKSGATLFLLRCTVYYPKFPAACHSRGTKQPCWDAKVALGQDKQRKLPFKIMFAICWSCPSATFASQHGGFVPREWQATKGLFILGPGRHVKSLYKACHLLEVATPGYAEWAN